MGSKVFEERKLPAEKPEGSERVLRLLEGLAGLELDLFDLLRT